SYSNFGSAAGPSPEKVRKAVAIARKQRPDLEIDGEMEVDVAMLDEERDAFPFSQLTGEANVFVFPDLDAANIGYKLIWRIGRAGGGVRSDTRSTVFARIRLMAGLAPARGPKALFSSSACALSQKTLPTPGKVAIPRSPKALESWSR